MGLLSQVHFRLFSKCKIVENIVSWRDLHRDRTTERATGVCSVGRVQLPNSSKCYVSSCVVCRLVCMYIYIFIGSMKYIIPCYRKALTIKHCNCRFTCPPRSQLCSSQVRVGDKCSIVIVDMKEFCIQVYRNQYRYCISLCQAY